MDTSEDSLLKNRLSQGVSLQEGIDPFNDGLYSIGLTEDIVNKLGRFINNIYEKLDKKNNSKQVTRNGLTLLRGAVFAIGTKKLNNEEWKEHCASSLREIVHEWPNHDPSSDYTLFFKIGGTKLTPSESKAFASLKHLYSYFTGIAHHEASTIMIALRNYLNDESLKLEDCYKDDVFLERVKEYFRIWGSLNTVVNEN